MKQSKAKQSISLSIFIHGTLWFYAPIFIRCDVYWSHPIKYRKVYLQTSRQAFNIAKFIQYMHWAGEPNGGSDPLNLHNDSYAWRIYHFLYWIYLYHFIITHKNIKPNRIAMCASEYSQHITWRSFLACILFYHQQKLSLFFWMYDEPHSVVL